MIPVAEHVPIVAMVAPWVLSMVGQAVTRMRERAEVTRRCTLTEVIGQLGANGLDGRVTYRDRRGVRWSVEVAATNAGSSGDDEPKAAAPVRPVPEISSAS
ncbi:hypothetical protein ACFY36_45015 [Actinoplanes sp. NPDC000266]